MGNPLEQATTFPMTRYNITEDCLTGLTPDQRAMFAILSLVLSEVEGLRKVIALGGSKPTGLDELDQAEISQRTVFFRLISMKLVEAFETMKLETKHNKTRDAGLLRFRDEIVTPELEKLKKMDGYKEAIRQRKKMGFHFDLAYFRSLTKLPDVQADHTVFVNGELGFQSFPYGEILVAAAYGNSEGRFNHSNALRNIELQTKFIQSQIQAFSRIFQAFFDEFIGNNAQWANGKLMVPNSLVARRGLDPFPLFIVEEEDT